MPGLMWPECVGSSWMTKVLMAIDWPSRSPDLNPIENLWDVMLSVHPPPPSSATDCPGAHWCPEPGLGGDAPDTIHHLIRSMPRRCRECIQARGGHTRSWRRIHELLWWNSLQVGSACDYNFTLIFGVILNPALNGLMILVPIHCSCLILFSTNYTMYINEDFQLYYLVHQGLICGLSVPLIFLSSVYCL